MKGVLAIVAVGSLRMQIYIYTNTVVHMECILCREKRVISDTDANFHVIPESTFPCIGTQNFPTHFITWPPHLLHLLPLLSSAPPFTVHINLPVAPQFPARLSAVQPSLSVPIFSPPPSACLSCFYSTLCLPFWISILPGWFVFLFCFSVTTSTRCF